MFFLNVIIIGVTLTPAFAEAASRRQAIPLPSRERGKEECQAMAFHFFLKPQFLASPSPLPAREPEPSVLSQP